MNNETRQQIKAVLGRKNPKYFATIRENGITRVQFVARNERDYYMTLYGDKIRFGMKGMIGIVCINTHSRCGKR